MDHTVSSSGEIERARMYWKEKLNGLVNLELPPLNGKDSLENIHSCYEHSCSRDLSKRLYEISKNNDVSLFTLLLTGLKVLIYKYTGEKDITVSSPAYLESESNKFVPVRDIINPKLSFKEILLKISKTLLDGYKNQFYPIEKAIGIYQMEKIMPVLVKMIISLTGMHNFDNVSSIAHSCYNIITIECKSEEYRLNLSVTYNSSLFSEKDMIAFIESYEVILSIIAYDINQIVEETSPVKIENKNILNINDTAGRLDRQIEINGYTVDLKEIEGHILRHEFIKNVVVSYNLNKNNKRYLYACYISDLEIQPALIKKFLQNSLPYYMIPSSFIKVTDIPLDERGRVDISLLPKPPDEIENEDEYCMPRNEIEQCVSEIWKKILKLEKVSLRKSFLDMGGNSILILKMVAELSKIYPNIISVPDVFSYPTIEQLTLQIAKRTEKLEGGSTRKYKDISFMSLNLPDSLLEYNPGRRTKGAALRCTFKKSLFKKALQTTGIPDGGEIQIAIAAYIYMLSVVSGERDFYTHVMASDDETVYPLRVNFNKINNIKTLVQHVNQSLESRGSADTYMLKDVNKINLKKNTAGAISLFCKVSSGIDWKGLLEVYDIVLGLQGFEDEISIVFRYDDSRIKNSKANEIFSLFINCVEEMASKL